MNNFEGWFLAHKNELKNDIYNEKERRFKLLREKFEGLKNEGEYAEYLKLKEEFAKN